MTRLAEVEAKVERLRRLLCDHDLDAVVLATHANFAWLSAGGHAHVGLATENAAGWLLVMPQARYLVTTNIEAERLSREELPGLGFEPVVAPWYAGGLADAAQQIGGSRLGSDAVVGEAREVSDAIAPLRWELLPPEVARYRQVAAATAQAVESTARGIEPAMTEHEIAARLARTALAAGLQLNVCLVAADERCSAFRHPLPTERRLQKLAMLVLGARRWGLCASVTRLVHFGPVPPDLQTRHQAVCEVDGTFLLNTVPGRPVASVLAAAIEAYGTAGFAEEWRLHHQGGATGYAPRDYKATPGCPQTVLPSQAFAWNPSIAGTKSEDTIVAQAGEAEVLSRTADWPQLTVTVGGRTIERPDILTR